MKRFLSLAVLMITLAASASTFNYQFKSTPLSQALTSIAKDHPDLNISFIYDRLENYTVSVSFDTENASDALRALIVHLPISLTKIGDQYIIEALQDGKYRYFGNTVDKQGNPVPFATVMLLSQADSTVITFGVTDDNGHFAIPCDFRNVIAKVSCLGFTTTYIECTDYNVGNITLPTNPIALHNITVNSENAVLLSDKSVFIPQPRQKRVAQTGYDLLSRMAIPQLRRGFDAGISTVGGEPVSVFIDYAPASSRDIHGMRVSDVRRVEYYDFPTDPRFAGAVHVINFIMTQYNYGGYVKVYGNENFIVNTGQAQFNTKYQVGRMTYDIGAGVYYNGNNHTGSDKTEIFSLPQSDGTVNTFDRHSETLSSRQHEDVYWGALKNNYKTDKTILNNVVSFEASQQPHNDIEGRVTYTPLTYETANYTTKASSEDQTITYKGNWTFYLPKNNTISVQPSYSFAKTVQNSLYTEGDLAPIANYATDRTNLAELYSQYSHNFGKAGNLQYFIQGRLNLSRTRYSGNTDNYEKANTTFLNTGASYSLKTGKLYTYAGFGWIWNHFTLNDINETSSKPWFDLSMQYAFSTKNSANLTFHYSTWPTSANYKSESVLQSSPLMYYTGNPGLNPTRSYDLWANYSYIPSSQWTLSAYGSAWIVGNRYAFVYEATPTHILRTIQQPIGSFAKEDYGINATFNTLDSKLQITGTVSQTLLQNGAPFDYSKVFTSYSAEAFFYAGKFYFGLCYYSKIASVPDSESGEWTTRKGFWWAQAGWANDNLNVRLFLRNMDKWNWITGRTTLNTSNYSFSQNKIGLRDHAFVQISATWNFGFGKKVERGNEASRQSGATSSILK